MLKSLTIEGLFGVYNYDLQFSKSDDDKIRFITAPNGFGKSTILKFINGLYNRDFDVFFSVPFTLLTFYIDSIIVRIEQANQSVMQESIDDDEETFITIVFGSSTDASGYQLRQTDITDKSDNSIITDVINQLDLFFASEKCIFVDDRRLLRENSDTSELVRFTELLKAKLKENSEETRAQVSVLKQIVERSEFVNKRFEVDGTFGFRFVANDQNETKLAMSALSSGEQHILLQALYLLFEAPSGTLVLIDEPEMSFHLSWQGDYLTNLLDIVSLRMVQCIISTHSPFVFGSQYSRSVDLFELSEM
jgi:predicted ATP-binding protein involved in virulence